MVAARPCVMNPVCVCGAVLYTLQLYVMLAQETPLLLLVEQVHTVQD